MDRIFRRFGLSGKSFIPILVATGCGMNVDGLVLALVMLAALLWQLFKPYKEGRKLTVYEGTDPMFAWLSANLVNLALILVLALIVGLLLRGMIRDKKAGKSSCGGNCAGCGACGGCSACASRGRCAGNGPPAGSAGAAR